MALDEQRRMANLEAGADLAARRLANDTAIWTKEGNFIKRVQASETLVGQEDSKAARTLAGLEQAVNSSKAGVNLTGEAISRMNSTLGAIETVLGFPLEESANNISVMTKNWTMVGQKPLDKLDLAVTRLCNLTMPLNNCTNNKPNITEEPFETFVRLRTQHFEDSNLQEVNNAVTSNVEEASKRGSLLAPKHRILIRRARLQAPDFDFYQPVDTNIEPIGVVDPGEAE